MVPFDLAIVLWPFFWLALVAVFFYGFSLVYHWVRFGTMYPLVWIALPVYVIGTVILIGAMLTGIAAV